MSENENPLAALADLDTINPEAVVESTPEDSVLVTDGAETPEADGDSESPTSDAPVEEVTEDELEEADCAPDTPTSPEAVGNPHSNLTSRAQRKLRQRGR